MMKPSKSNNLVEHQKWRSDFTGCHWCHRSWTPSRGNTLMWRSRTRTTALRSGQKRRQLQQLQQLQDLLGHMLLALHRRCWKWCCFVGPCLGNMTDWYWLGIFKLQVESIQRILQDPLEMVPLLIATFRSIHLQIHLAVQYVCRARHRQLPRLTCDRWGTQDLGDGSNLIVICLGGWKSINTS